MRELNLLIYIIGEPFILIPLRLIEDRDSTKADLLVYLSIASILHGRKWGLPTQKEIMRRAKYTSTRTIMNTITHLEKIGWATKKRRGLTQSNIVILHQKKNQRVTPKRWKEIKDEVEEDIY